jgi:hypothetical protein
MQSSDYIELICRNSTVLSLIIVFKSVWQLDIKTREPRLPARFKRPIKVLVSAIALRLLVAFPALSTKASIR